MNLLGSLLLLLLPSVDCYIWAWMLSMPYNNPEDSAGLVRSATSKVTTVTCDHDRGCGRGLFCDHHFGLCVPLRHEGQYCRKDSQCIRGLGCMYGHCQRIIPGGHEGSRCRQDKDCLPSMCCARHHGEMICKRKLSAGSKCYVPEGGLAFSINQLCPCEEGLVCSSPQPPREKEFIYSPILDWKCASPSL
ncbi:dickkopf-related protein 3-like [Rana temporaria]|uniref:dickkopf-related protein 3-like n=1 Tax=Rana temporaria TaxID=8407 RepID=UPI001AAD3563|nr:dickkopf-related protein 3-like [Rana temporaria]